METQFIWGCGRKHRYRTEGKARIYAARCESERGVALKVYHCQFCLGWHMAKHKPEGTTRMKLYLKNARLAFTPTLFVAKAGQPSADNPNPQPKFSVASIIEAGTLAAYAEANPDSAAGVAAGAKWGAPRDAFNAAINDAATRKWGAKANEILLELKAGGRLFVHDGDAKASQPGFKGNLYINASNTIKPNVVSANGTPLTGTEGIIYPGCYGYVILESWPQDNKFGKRVNASLLGVMFQKDGERLAGGGVATSDDYAPIPDMPVGANTAAGASANAGGAASLF